jgi:hypothetical protein
MSVNIGGTLSFERLIQTLGRCTGRGFPVGHQVTILSNGLDFDAARAFVVPTVNCEWRVINQRVHY